MHQMKILPVVVPIIIFLTLIFIFEACVEYSTNVPTITKVFHKYMSTQEDSISISKWLSGPAQPDDPILLNYIRRVIVPPSQLEYNIKNPNQDTSVGQMVEVEKILGQKTNGFFIECGAYDGEEYSTTYYFERYRGWKGILIEPNMDNFQVLLTKNRKAASLNACLSTKQYPEQVVFHNYLFAGSIVNESKTNFKDSKTYSLVQCYPLYSILLALNRTDIDYFSLDVEGAELDVLKTIPFDRVKIKVLSVEFFLVPNGKQAITDFMKSHGYYVYSELMWGNVVNDLIFVKNGIIPVVAMAKTTPAPITKLRNIKLSEIFPKFKSRTKLRAPVLNK